MSRINKCAATEQEVAKYHNDGWVNKRAKIVSVPVGKQSISESGRKCVRPGKVCMCVPLHRFLSMCVYSMCVSLCRWCAFFSVYIFFPNPVVNLKNTWYMLCGSFQVSKKSQILEIFRQQQQQVNFYFFFSAQRKRQTSTWGILYC